jgi:hypothetical protein
VAGLSCGPVQGEAAYEGPVYRRKNKGPWLPLSSLQRYAIGVTDRYLINGTDYFRKTHITGSNYYSLGFFWEKLR